MTYKGRAMSLSGIEIIDYKDGMNPVEAEANPQLMIYAAGVLQDLKKKHNPLPNWRVTLTIIQPKLRLKSKTGISSWETDVQGVYKFMSELKQAAEQCDDPEAPLVAGDKQCKWCAHKGSCASFAKHNMEGISIMFGDISKQAADKEPTNLSDDEIAEIVESAPLVRQMLTSVEEEALRRMKSGKTIKGLKVVHGNGSRKWSVSEEEIADKLKRMGVPKSEYYVTKLVSPAQAEKLKWSKKDGTIKQLSERQVKILHSEYITKSAGKLKVVPESHDGEAVVFDAAPMFSETAQIELPDWMK